MGTQQDKDKPKKAEAAKADAGQGGQSPSVAVQTQGETGAQQENTTAANTGTGQPQATPEAEQAQTHAQQPSGGAPAPDPTEPADPDPQNSVGGDNPNQPPVGEDAGVSAATPGRAPSEAAGYAPIPDPNTGAADSDGVPYTQATQRLVSPDDSHPIAQALGTVTNIPPGSRPSMIDPDTGLGVQPPQTERRDEA